MSIVVVRGNPPARVPADAAALVAARPSDALLSGYNGTTSDLWRNNTEGTILASAARTASTNSADQTNYNARGVIVILTQTVNPGASETLQLVLQARDPIDTAGYFNLSTPTTATAFGGGTGSIRYILYPGINTTAGGGWDAQFSVALPRIWRVRVVHSAAGSWTYSVGYQYIV